MVDASAVYGFVQSLKSASDIAKAMMDLRDFTAVQAKSAELLREINTAYERAFAANAAQAELLERIHRLEEEKRQAEHWAREKQRYRLVDVYKGRLAYLVKEEARGEEPVHYICPDCAEKAQKSIMQGDHGAFGEVKITCPTCKLSLTTGYEKF